MDRDFFLNVALREMARGWYVHPLAPARKGPGSAHGKNDATLDEARIREWWTKTPAANVGINTGLSGLCVMDADHGLKDEAAFFAWRDRNHLPSTYTVRSGRRDDFGAQMYYLGSLKDGKFELDGVTGDIKSAGGLVLAAGCIHPDSHEAYVVLVDLPLVAVPPIVEQSRVRKPEPTPGAPREQIGEGGRRNELVAEAGRVLHAVEMDKDILLAHLLDFNNKWCVPPLSEEEVQDVAQRCNWKPSERDPVVVVKSPEPMAEPSMVAEKSERAVYPTEEWAGTIAAEFAKICTEGNNIPPKLYLEAFRTYLAAAFGDRVRGPYRGMHCARMYTTMIAPAGHGKGEAIRSTDDFFDGMKELVTGFPDSVWKSKGIGARNAAFSSVPGLAAIIQDSDKLQEVSPHLCWRGTVPRLITTQEELKSFLSSLFIQGGVGADLEGVLCALWDGTRFHGKGKSERAAVYGQVQFSLLGGITPLDWFELLGQGNVIGSGFYSRLNLVGTEGEFELVARIREPEFTALQDILLPRLEALVQVPYTIDVKPEADALLDAWMKDLPAGSERLNIYALRTAMTLAWLKDTKTITPALMESALRLGDHQLKVRQFYRVEATRNETAALQSKIKKWVQGHGPSAKWAVARGIHYQRYGTDKFDRAWVGLTRAGVLVPVKDTALFGLAKVDREE
jgi:Bifunctional DNA primase/polymerase, N-terminal